MLLLFLYTKGCDYMLLKSLKFGDTIGIVSPASPEKFEAIANAIEYLESLGFKVKVGKHIYTTKGFFAGSHKDRAQDIIDMFLDNEISLILCMRGGYGTMRILEYLNFEIIKNHPKLFMGFSDITTLLNNIQMRSGIITFHGPMASSNISEHYTLKSFLDTLMLPRDDYLISNPDYLPIECSVNGIAEGILVGGNLCLICSTIGTPYELDTDDKILFLEEIGEAPYRIDRMLTQLLLSGKLKKCKGFILGQFKNCGLLSYDKSFTLEEVLEDRLFSLKKPTLNHLMSGHSYPKLTLPIGAKVQINCNIGQIKVLEKIVK